MKCVTIKEDMECGFMTVAGCGFNGGACYPVVEACEGCNRIVELQDGLYCMTYADPSAKWAYGHCNFATHTKSDNGSQATAGQKVNPLKQSKRMARSR
jgi:hypothetical protein